MPIRIYGLLGPGQSPAFWHDSVRSHLPDAHFTATATVAEWIRCCEHGLPDVMVIDLSVPGAGNLIGDAHICRPDHHLLALVPADFFWPSAWPAPAAKLKAPWSTTTALAALHQVMDLAAAALPPPHPDPHPDRVIHHGEAEDEHLVWLESVPRILVVDDNAMILRFAEAALASEFPDHAVITVETGREGLDCARHLHPRLILLDYALPDFNGDSFARQLRDDPQIAAIPVVMMSGYNDLMLDAAQHHPNVVGTLNKPFKAADLFQVLRRAMAFVPPPPVAFRPLSELTTRILRQQRPLQPPGTT